MTTTTMSLRERALAAWREELAEREREQERERERERQMAARALAGLLRERLGVDIETDREWVEHDGLRFFVDWDLSDYRWRLYVNLGTCPVCDTLIAPEVASLAGLGAALDQATCGLAAMPHACGEETHADADAGA